MSKALEQQLNLEFEINKDLEVTAKKIKNIEKYSKEIQIKVKEFAGHLINTISTLLSESLDRVGKKSFGSSLIKSELGIFSATYTFLVYREQEIAEHGSQHLNRENAVAAAKTAGSFIAGSLGYWTGSTVAKILGAKGSVPIAAGVATATGSVWLYDKMLSKKIGDIFRNKNIDPSTTQQTKTKELNNLANKQLKELNHEPYEMFQIISEKKDNGEIRYKYESYDIKHYQGPAVMQQNDWMPSSFNLEMLDIAANKKYEIESFIARSSGTIAESYSNKMHIEEPTKQATDKINEYSAPKVNFLEEMKKLNKKQDEVAPEIGLQDHIKPENKLEEFNYDPVDSFYIYRQKPEAIQNSFMKIGYSKEEAKHIFDYNYNQRSQDSFIYTTTHDKVKLPSYDGFICNS